MRTRRQRLFIGLLSWLALVLASFSGAVFLLVRQDLLTDLDQFLRDKAFLLGYQVNPNLRTAVGGDDRVWRSDHYLTFGQTHDANWNLLYKSVRLAEPIPVTDEIKRIAKHSFGVVVHDVAGHDGTPYRMATVRSEHQGKFICYSQIAVKIAERDAPLKTLLAWLTGGSFVALIVGGIGIDHLLRHWAAPLVALANAARQIQLDTLSRQRLYAPPDAPELAQLADAFNTLIDQLDAAHASQHQFVADASHELRTPLAALRAEIEVCLRRERSPADYQGALHTSRHELERLTALVESLLSLARLDARVVGKTSELVNLAACCRDVVEQLTPLAASRGVHLHLEVPDDLPVRGDVLSLERAVRNLVENAIHHTPSGEQIVVLAKSEKGVAQLQVIDHGVGIAPEHLPRIFDRFYRVDTARTRATGGAGLGLSIVKAIVEAHQGTVAVESRLGQGTTLTLRVPGSSQPSP